MHFQSESATNALRSLERLTVALNAMSGRGRIIEAASTVERLERILEKLENEVVHSDGLGVFLASEDELVFRTKRLIITSGLVQLDESIQAMGVTDATDLETASMWRRLLPAINTGHVELQRITNLWQSRRGADLVPLGGVNPVAHRKTLDVMIRELRNLDQIPDVERLLYRGVASTERPAIARACEQVLVAIHVRIDLNKARQLWSARSRWEQAIAGR